MRIKVRLFASLREAAGQPDVALNLEEGARVADVWSALCADAPELQPFHDRTLAAVNRRYVSAEHPLSDGDELALFPPVSGG